MIKKGPNIFRIRSVLPKILILTTTILAVSIAASSYFALGIIRHQFMENAKGKVTSGLNGVEKMILSAMEAGQPEHMKLAMGMIRSYPHQVEFRIYNPRGGIVFYSGAPRKRKLPEEILSQFESGRSLSQIKIIKKDHLIRAYKALPNRPRCFPCHGAQQKFNGIIETEMSLSSFDSQQKLAEVMLGLNSFVTFFVLVLSLNVLLLVMIVRPISKLAAAMREVEKGNLDIRAEVRTKDEIGTLAKGFNAVVDRLARLIRQEKERHQSELQHAERLATLGELAAGIAHEVRNPIAGISGAIQVLESGLKPDDPNRHIIQEIHKEIKRLDIFLSDFLQYARPAEPQFRFVDIHQILERTVSLCTRGEPSKRIKIRKLYSKRLPKLFVDPVLMQQVFMNIMLNAIQAMDGEGQLTIQTRRTKNVTITDRAAEIIFTDTGHGISKEDQAQIFKPFFSSKKRGTGLGLTIVSRIVEQHKGRIEVESEPGKGATFRIILPLIQFQGGTP